MRQSTVLALTSERSSVMDRNIKANGFGAICYDVLALHVPLAGWRRVAVPRSLLIGPLTLTVAVLV